MKKKFFLNCSSIYIILYNHWNKIYGEKDREREKNTMHFGIDFAV